MLQSSPKGPDQKVVYEPAGPVVKAFQEDTSFVRGIMGPLGSSKSTACVMEILRRSMQQAPATDGKRYTRWAIIRNTYPELKTTTIKTWHQWCPAQYGRMTMTSPMRHHVVTPTLDMEVYFMALDVDEDVKKLLSLELTGAWINEAREIPKSILDALTGRVGRYPSMNQGGASWFGIIMDTNPPDDQSWWYRYAEEETPKDWKFFKQPSGRSPEAENLKNLPRGYYDRLCQGKEDDWINVYVDGNYGYLTEGKPVFPMFRDRTHVSPTPLAPVPGLSLLVGSDFGLTPCAVFGQRLADGRWIILEELITEDCGIIRFAELVVRFATEKFPDHAKIFENEEFKKRLIQQAGYAQPIQGWGDPAGNQKSQNDEKTALEVLREHTPWRWKPAPSNSLSMRLEVVKAALNRMVDGKPGILISPTCKTLRKGFASGYHYRYIKSSGGSQTHSEPNKNDFSHPHDALQYLLLGGGEANVVLGRMNARERRRGRPDDPDRNMARDVDYRILG